MGFAATLGLMVVLAACDDAEPAGGVPGGAGATGAGATGGNDGVSGSGGAAGSAENGGAAGAGIDEPPYVPPEPSGTSFSIRETVRQLQVWKAAPATEAILRDGEGATVATATTDKLGSIVFRELAPGTGYTISVGDETTRALQVFDEAGSKVPQSFYSSQKLVAGNGYITTRDGTKLAVFITLPGPPEDGPYPTVVNYSGYDPARPGAPVSAQAKLLCPDFPVLCDAPADPSALIASLMGYATVGVNMRGTGCSGGPYDFFETMQVLDGYDIIETVAAQPWVKHHKVGMTGLSYPGISQLFVAQQNPPSLAAITPLSVIGNTATTMRPGGILNDGFAINWASAVVNKADPYGQGWEQARVDGGDTVCEENQLLHGQKVDIIAKARNTPYFDPAVYSSLNPTAFVHDIQVPVFLSGSWQDEQTGPVFAPLLSRFTGAPVFRATVTNGVHPDGFAPQDLVEWKAFLDLYVAKEVPKIDEKLRDISGLLFQTIFGVAVTLPPDRFAGYATHAEALAAFEAEDPIRVIFDTGAGKKVGAPEGVFETRLPAWPPPSTVPTRFYFQPDGTMQADKPTEAEAASEFDLDPTAGQRGILKPGGDVWDPLPDYDWKAPPSGQVVAFESPVLTANQVLLGTGSVDIYVRSNQADADLEANLTEVRADGQEVYVQSGWLRASQRALSSQATELWPDITQEEKDAAPLPAGEWTLVHVPIAGAGHVFRQGSRIRVAIDTPGDSRAEWRFDLLKFEGGATHQIAHDAAHTSSVVLPFVTGIDVPSPQPACPSLRGQPCRAYVATTNRPAATPQPLSRPRTLRAPSRACPSSGRLSAFRGAEPATPLGSLVKSGFLTMALRGREVGGTPTTTERGHDEARIVGHDPVDAQIAVPAGEWAVVDGEDVEASAQRAAELEEARHGQRDPRGLVRDLDSGRTREREPAWQAGSEPRGGEREQVQDVAGAGAGGAFVAEGPCGEDVVPMEAREQHAVGGALVADDADGGGDQGRGARLQVDVQRRVRERLQDRGEGWRAIASPEVWPLLRPSSAGIDEHVAQIPRLDFAERASRHPSRAAGQSLACFIMKNNDFTIGCEVHVRLQGVGTEGERTLERLECVFRQLHPRPAVREEERIPVAAVKGGESERGGTRRRRASHGGSGGSTSHRPQRGGAGATLETSASGCDS
jgi:uncharacterized protein